MPQDRPSSQDPLFESGLHAAEPTSEAPSSNEGEFTRMFRALNNDAESSAQPPSAAVPAPKAEALPLPSASAMPEPVPSAAYDSQPADPGEFTQIFRQIPKPTSAPPLIPAATPSPAGGAGEFTQIFRQIEKPSSAPPPIRAAAPSPAEAPNEFTGLSQQAQPSAPAPVVASVPPAALGNMPRTSAPTTAQPAVPASGDFTQIFQSAGRNDTPPPLPDSRGGAEFPFAAPVFAERSAAAPPASSGDFTQLFQALEDAPAQSTSGAFGASRGAVPSGAAAFAQPVAPTMPAPQRPPAAPAGPGEFTQLMQGLSQSAPSASGAPGPSRAATPMDAAAFAQPIAPTMPAPQRPPAAPAGPGEFTQLMQGLSQSEPRLTQGAAPVSPVFGQALSPPGGSEFTRVMRGSAFRDKVGQDLPVSGVAAVQPTAARAPGLAVAPPSTPKLEAGGAKEDKKPSRLMLLLVLFNVLLVIALAVLGFLLLHRRH